MRSAHRFLNVLLVCAGARDTSLMSSVEVMTHTRTATDKESRPLLWIAISVTLIASVFAVYFAFRAHQEHSIAASSAAESKVKEAELSATVEQLTRSRSDAAATMPIVSPTPLEQASTPAFSAVASTSPSRSADPATFLHSPAFHEMKRQTSLATLRPIYDGLLTQLNLSPEQRAQFYELQLVVDDPAGNLEKLPYEAGTPEERAQIEGQIRDTRESALAQLREMLGPRDYPLYETYLKTESERMLVEQFRQRIDSKALQMSDWQFQRLGDALIQAWSRYPPVNDDMSAVYNAALAQAAQFLRPEQLAAFRGYLANQNDLAGVIQTLKPPGN